MEKVTIRGEELTVHEMPVRAGLLSEWEKDAHRAVRETVGHAQDILGHLGEADSFEWSLSRGLVQAMGGERIVYPLLSKPVRQTMEWVGALEKKELARLALAVYEANKKTFDAILAEDFGPAEEAAFLKSSMSGLYRKLAEYGYSDEEVLQMPIGELRDLYLEIAEADQHARERFEQLLPSILGKIKTPENEQGQNF